MGKKSRLKKERRNEILFVSTHKLHFETARHDISEMLGEGFILYRVGTCEGLWRPTNKTYDILAIDNKEPGNGHLKDVFEWFENSCKRDKKNLRVMHLWNKRFRKYLEDKMGFIPEPINSDNPKGENLIKLLA